MRSFILGMITGACVMIAILFWSVGQHDAKVRVIQAEKTALAAQVATLTVENKRLTERNSLLEDQVRAHPQPASYPVECPVHSEMGQEADGSWQIICIDPWSDYGLKSVSIRRSAPEVSTEWTQRETLIIRAIIYDPPMDPKPPAPSGPAPWPTR